MLNLHFSLVAFQVQSSGSVDRETLLVIFVGIIALFFLALIIGLAAAVVYALKLKRDVLKSIDTLKATMLEKARPVVASTNEFIRDMTPKIKSITDDAVEISHTVRAQVTDLDSTLSDVTAKARAQADRVNGMVSSTLNTTSNVVTSMERGVRMPIREVAGVLAGIKAGWKTLTRPVAPSAKSEVKRAARHVDGWEAEVANDAARASHVNESPVHEADATAARVRGASVETGRFTIEAGEEIVAPTANVEVAAQDGSLDRSDADVSRRTR